MCHGCRASGIERLEGAPDFKIHVAIGDSLLHGTRFGRLDLGDNDVQRLRAHRYASEDNGALSRILGRPYHAVVANPPYITPKDPAENRAYRALYESCYRQYALAVPFIERCFDLAVDGRRDTPGGHVGLIVANSFMKREFGKKLIEEVLPKLDLTHVIDTAGAYIPGHGTPTVILFGRNGAPVARTVRTVMGIKGEPSPPEDPSNGLVWSAIRAQVDLLGSESVFASVADTLRGEFSKHPWSLGGGGAAQLRQTIEANSYTCLEKLCSDIGYGALTREDSAYLIGRKALERSGFPSCSMMPIVEGECVRDFSITDCIYSVWPYGVNYNPIGVQVVTRFLWRFRKILKSRVAYGLSQIERGLFWYEYSMIFRGRIKTPLTIAFAEVATHNHFVLDRGGKVFKQTAPIIKLDPIATENDHLSLMGLLNSSTVCFWLKQVCFPKGGDQMGGEGARVSPNKWEDRYAHDGTKVGKVPLGQPFPINLAQQLDSLAIDFNNTIPAVKFAEQLPTRARLVEAAQGAAALRAQMITLQEELDWRCYRLYGLTDQDLEHPDPPPLALGERAFEIVMARAMAAGELETAWFERHRSTPITELPAHWPVDYRSLVERRISLIESHRWIGLVERPEYKRRWSMRPWDEQEREALKTWLLDRLEDSRYWSGEPALVSTNRLADLARRDQEFLQVAELYAGRADYDLPTLVRELVTGEAVPFLPVLRYTEAGLRKRAEWETCWRLQRQEDVIDAAVEAERPVFEAAARKTVRQEIERATRRSAGEGDDAYDKRVEALVEAAAERITTLTDSHIQQEQRRRKADEVGDIPVPPKYGKVDFQKSGYWRLRGGLDVPKERFVSYPHCEREADGSPVVSWAGFDHLQEAQAIATYYLERKEREGWSIERLEPLLASVIERLPWLMQWHNTYDPAFGMGMGDYFKSFVEDEARALGKTPEQIAAWQPPANQVARRGRRRKVAAE